MSSIVLLSSIYSPITCLQERTTLCHLFILFEYFHLLLYKYWRGIASPSILVREIEEHVMKLPEICQVEKAILHMWEWGIGKRLTMPLLLFLPHYHPLLSIWSLNLPCNLSWVFPMVLFCVITLRLESCFVFNCYPLILANHQPEEWIIFLCRACSLSCWVVLEFSVMLVECCVSKKIVNEGLDSMACFHALHSKNLS